MICCTLRPVSLSPEDPIDITGSVQDADDDDPVGTGL